MLRAGYKTPTHLDNKPDTTIQPSLVQTFRIIPEPKYPLKSLQMDKMHGKNNGVFRKCYTGVTTGFSS